MSDQWFFQNRGQALGPFSTPEMKNLAAAGLLLPDDRIWPAHGNAGQAVQACAALDFTTLHQVAVPAPDWLDDVEVETGPRAVDWGKPALPDWLSDIAQSEGLQPPPALSTAPVAGPPPVAALDSAMPVSEPILEIPPENVILDTDCDVELLDEVLPADEPPVAEVAPPEKPPVPSALPAAPVPPLPAPPPAIARQERPLPVARPVVSPVVAQAPPAPAVPQALSPPGAPGALPPPASPAIGQVPQAVPAPPLPAPAAPAIDPRQFVIALMGFDPRTGEVTDAAQFKQWRKEQTKLARSQAAAQPGKTIQEVFHEARSILERWVDAEGNRSLILTGDLDAVRRHPALQEFLDRYRGYGTPMMAKLWRQVDYLVENRKKYYEAVARKNPQAAAPGPRNS